MNVSPVPRPRRGSFGTQRRSCWCRRTCVKRPEPIVNASSSSTRTGAASSASRALISSPATSRARSAGSTPAEFWPSPVPPVAVATPTATSNAPQPVKAIRSFIA